MRRALPIRHWLLALVVTVVVASAFFSSFLGHPRGVVDAVRAYGLSLDRAGAASPHAHPWDYYLRLLIHFPSKGTPFWTEGLILALAVCGGVAGWVKEGASGAEAKALRFLALYTLLLLVAYSVIPYKTPWCVLGILQGLILLAGPGAVLLVRTFRGRGARVLVGLLLGAAALHLGWQAFSASFRFAADPRNPYVYAHTGTDVFEIVGRVTDLCRAHPDGTSMPVQVLSRENLWPLPFYLRGLSKVAWSSGVSDRTPNAPVILVTPDMEEALVRKLYDLPAPGERELYVSVFERPVELRPGVEVRGYATSRLWEDFLRRQGEPKVPGRRP
jgi:predicted membrane-bound mannosyltransferase